MLRHRTKTAQAMTVTLLAKALKRIETTGVNNRHGKLQEIMSSTSRLES